MHTITHAYKGIKCIHTITHAYKGINCIHTTTHAYKGMQCIHTQVMAAKRRYEVGLQKLEFTEQQVVIMQNELTELKPKLIK